MTLPAHPQAGSEGSTCGKPQSMEIDIENNSAIILKPSTSTGLGETTGKGRVTTHEVRGHAATCIADAYRFHQVLGNIQPVPTVLGNTQDTHMDCIPGPAQVDVNALGHVDTAMIQSDAINTGYHQTLSTFTTVVNGITMVCHPNGRWSSLTDGHA